MRLLITFFILFLTLASFAQEREIIAACKLNNQEFTVVVATKSVELNDTTSGVKYTFPSEKSLITDEGVDTYKMENDNSNFVSVDELNRSGFLHAVTSDGQRVSGNLTCVF